jgi:hypothetical protein
MLVGERLEIAHLSVDELHHFLDRHAEHHTAPHRRGRVVHMHDRAPRADETLDAALDERLARLREHHQRDVVRHELLIDERTNGVVVRLRSGRKAHFDFPKAYVHEHFEEPLLSLAAHGLEQRLVAIAQIGAAPDGRGGDLARGPLPVGQVNGRERTVFLRRIAQHGFRFH